MQMTKNINSIITSSSNRQTDDRPLPRSPFFLHLWVETVPIVSFHKWKLGVFWIRPSVGVLPRRPNSKLLLPTFLSCRHASFRNSLPQSLAGWAFSEALHCCCSNYRLPVCRLVPAVRTPDHDFVRWKLPGPGCCSPGFVQLRDWASYL